MNDRVSVILPYYNRQETLAEAVDSVLAQRHQDLFLLLIDDGSTDGSKDVARSFRDSRVIHIDMDGNRGVSAARNAGLDGAETPLVAFMDSDDRWLPEKLSVQIDYLRGAQQLDPLLAVAGCGWQFYDGRTQAKQFNEGPYSRIDVLHNRVAGMGTPTLLIDTVVATKDARFDESLPSLEEGDYVMSCLSNGTKLIVVPDILLLVRRGRVDHLATPDLTARAWEAFLAKYESDLDHYPQLRSWYSYRAARDHLINRNIMGSLRHARLALSYRTAERTMGFVLGLLGGRSGLAISQRFFQLLPGPSDQGQGSG